VDFVFVPHLKNTQANEETTGTAVCPYVQGTAACSRTALAMNHMDASRLLSPLVDMRMRERDIIKTLSDELARPLGCSPRDLRRAWRAGLQAQTAFEDRCQEEGAKILAEATAKNEKMILLVGRPYNNYDGGANLGLPQKIADMGRTVLPMDFVKPDLSRLGVRYRNAFWSYGQKILAVLEQAADAELLDVVYLTNFSCGPDSFLLSFTEEIMGRRPLLMLETGRARRRRWVHDPAGGVLRCVATAAARTRPARARTHRAFGSAWPHHLGSAHAPVRHAPVRRGLPATRLRRAYLAR